MSELDLSEIEIRLYNASRQFAHGLNEKDKGWDYFTKMTDFSEDILCISILPRKSHRGDSSRSGVSVDYFKDYMGSGKESLRISGGLEKEYREFVLKNILGIADILQKENMYKGRIKVN